MRGWIVGAMSCVLGGCLMSNPDWDGVAEEASTGLLEPSGSGDGSPAPVTTGTSAGSVGGSGDSDPTRETGDTGKAPADADTDTGPEPITKWYEAVDAYCMSDVTLDPEACTLTRSADGELLLSATDTETIAIFLKFEVDPSFEGRTVTRADVVLAVMEPSETPGSLYQIEPFTLETLTMGFPDPAGRPLAEPRGPAEAETLMWFVIPDEIAETTESLYFGLYPAHLTTMSYGGAMHREPPRLVVTYAPP